MSDPESSSNDTNAPDSRMLEELDEHIREARAAAEDAIGYEGGPSFVESGEVSSDDKDDGDDDDVEDRTDTDSTEDDQTIAPPG
jgi:hypothetical protein